MNTIHVWPTRLKELLLAIPFTSHRMVEVRGVEPLSETESTELLRVYPAFNLGRSTPTGGLISFHPFGSAPLSERAEPP